MNVLVTVRIFYFNVFKYYNLSDSIISDRETQFVFYFWLVFCDILEINTFLSTVFYFETDGQTERINVFIEIYLKTYISYLQDNWIK